jgi:hypothetical protein
MQEERLSRISKELTDTLLDSLWIQWGSLGSFVDTNRCSSSLVDPDALLLMSLTLRQHEKRLWDLLASWAGNGSKLFSIQRVKNLVKGFPSVTRERLSEFSYRAINEGKDHRWKALSGTNGGPEARSRILWEAYPRVWHPTALILRLRLGFGIGITSDLLAYLLSLNGAWSSTTKMSLAIEYSQYSIRRNADAMTAAGFLESTNKKPFQYRVNTPPWKQLLSINGVVPGWKYWNKLFSFLATYLFLLNGERAEGQSPYLLSSELRDLVGGHEDAFNLNNIDYPKPQVFIGEDYLSGVIDFVPALADWIRENV